MKRLLFVFMFLLPLSLLAQTTYYVSNSGSDSNSGMSESSPWRSLTKVNSYFFMAGDKILFKRGDSWEGTITVRTSGTAGNPITYGAYGSGNKPRIYGSEVITGWTRYSGNIYKATVGKEVTQLFIDGERASIARYPKSGYLSITSVANSKKFISSGLASQSRGYYGGAFLAVKSKVYILSRHTVAGSEGNSLTIDSSPSGDLNTGEGFFLYNKLAFLTEAGEWCYDRGTGNVYVWMPNGNSPVNYEIRVSIYNDGVKLNNGIDYVNINELDFRHQSSNGIYMYSSDNITVENNRISECSGVGIDSYYVGNKLIFRNNEISDVFERAIHINYGNDNQIEGNTIDTIGRLKSLGSNSGSVFSPGTAIVSNHGNCDILYNKITNCGYCAIYFKSGVCNIYRNFINGALMELNDGGAIYSVSNNYSDSGIAGSSINENIILNVFGESDGTPDEYHLAFGVYLDGKIHDVIIENNLIAKSSGGVNLNRGGENIVKNNTFFDCLVDINSAGQEVSSTVENNIMYKTDRTGTLPALGKNRNQRFVFQSGNADNNFDDNVYTVPYTEDYVFVGYDSFEAWQASGNDINGVYDGKDMVDGETEELLYNETKSIKTFDLGSNIYRDIYGNNISGILILEPYKSKILVGADFDGIEVVVDDATATNGYTDVYDLTTTMRDRRAMPVSFTESGEITSLSIYHNGGTGSMLMGVYSDSGGSPGTLLGVTSEASVSRSEGWQTVWLSSPVSVTSGATVWLSWLFEDATEVRYQQGTPGRARALSSYRWEDGMPSFFGVSDMVGYQYSVYCSYSIPSGDATATNGYTDVYDLTTTMRDRRAMPVSFTESGEITSLSIYHNGGTGSMLMGVYSDSGGSPGTLLGVTSEASVSRSEGWQTVWLSSPVSVTSGATVWLSWLFEDATEVRYQQGTPGRARALSSYRWEDGMPSFFGVSDMVGYQYSVYCSYSIPSGDATATNGYTDVYDLTTTMRDRRAMPVSFTESGEITSLSIYHNGGTGSMLMGVYSDSGGSPGTLLGVTSEASVSRSEGWQTVWLSSPVSVTSGATVWLSWLFEDATEVRYQQGTPGRARALSSYRWEDGMPSFFGVSDMVGYQYSVYCSYSIPSGDATATNGYTDVYDLTTTMRDRRAMPVSFTESGEITSLSIYHNGGTGSMLMGVYSDSGGSPGTLLGVTSEASVSRSEGWQTVWLSSPVSVTSGATVWLSWLFEDATEVRYQQGTPGRARALSSYRWEDGMPSFFGVSDMVGYQYSVYCSYSIPSGDATATNGYTDVYDLTTTMRDRRAMPVSFTESGEITSLSIYHNGGTGSMLMGVYSDSGGSPGTLLGVTSEASVSRSEGWQTVWLSSPVSVTSGATVWLSWLFEDATEVRYQQGTPGRARALSSYRWEDGMPSFFGVSDMVGYQYSVYCSYTMTLSKSVSILSDKELANTSFDYLTQYFTEEVTINEGEAYQSWTDSGTYQRLLKTLTRVDSIVTTILYVIPADFVSEANNREVADDLNEEGILPGVDLSIFPNPANTCVYIECSFLPELKTKMIILDSSGKIILNELVQSVSVKIDVSDFPAGMYFVRMVNEKSSITQKLIISR